MYGSWASLTKEAATQNHNMEDKWIAVSDVINERLLKIEK